MQGQRAKRPVDVELGPQRQRTQGALEPAVAHARGEHQLGLVRRGDDGEGVAAVLALGAAGQDDLERLAGAELEARRPFQVEGHGALGHGLFGEKLDGIGSHVVSSQ